MKLPPYQPPAIKKKITSELTEGFAYLKNTPSIGLVILMLSLMSFLVLPYNTLIPIFAKEIFMGNAATFGYINSFVGLGAIAGTFFLASLKPGTNLKMVLLVNTIILGIGLMLFSHTSYFPLAMLFAVFCGFGTMSQTSICITIVQVHSARNMRGRVVSYVAMSVFGMLPLGSLIIGLISQQISAPNTLLCEGAIAVLITAVFSRFLRKDTAIEKDMAQIGEAEEIAIEKM